MGEVVELPGCHTQGADLASLERNVREAIAVYKTTQEAVPQGEPGAAAPQSMGTWRIEVSA